MGIGQVIELAPDFEAWVVTALEADPDAIWAVRFDDGTEPESYPETMMAVLVRP